MTAFLRYGSIGLLLLAVRPAAALEVRAVTQWAQRSELSTPLSGVVAEVPAIPGQRVEKGALLARLDDRVLTARLAEGEAGVEEARQHRAEARRELERAQDLYERTVLSQHELQSAEIAAAEAEAAYTRASSALAQAQVALEYSRLRAPFDAVVIGVAVRPGETVVNHLSVHPMVTLAAARAMRARALLSETQIGGLEVGGAAKVIQGGRSLQARIAEVGLEAAERAADGSVLYPVEAEFDLPEGEVWPAGRTLTLQLGGP